MSEEKKYPEAIVGALVINNNEKLLFCKSHKWKGKYTVFGGHVEYGESMKDAIVRETKEETGLNIKVIANIGTSNSIFNSGFHKKKHFIFIDYFCKYDGGDDKIKINKEYEDDYKWATAKEAQELDLADGARLILEEYINYKESKNNLEGWKRCQADFENYKKDQAKIMGEFRKFASLDMVLQILPVLDNFNSSLEHVPENEKDNAWVTGIIYIKKQLEDALKNNGAEEIEVKIGDKFNPEIHEAITDAKQPASPAGGRIESESTNKISKVVQKGYKIGGKVIRAARVVVG